MSQIIARTAARTAFRASSTGLRAASRRQFSLHLNTPSERVPHLGGSAAADWGKMARRAGSNVAFVLPFTVAVMFWPEPLWMFMRDRQFL